MKAGTTLEKLAIEITRRAEAKKDYIAPVDKLAMQLQPKSKETLGLEPVLALQKMESTQGISYPRDKMLPLTPLAHEQLATYLDIPVGYYRRMLDTQSDLLASNVNTWLPTKTSKRGVDRRMVRTLDGKVRALLSDAYRPLENEALAEAALPVLLEEKLVIISCEITDTRLYIKALDKRVQTDIPTGRKMGDGSHVFFDTVCPAITISNSEVGMGTLSIETGVYTRMCTNLATFGATMRKFHTGSRADLSDEVYALLTDKTRQLTDAAIWSQTRDLVKGAFSAAKFEAEVKLLTEATEQPLGDDPIRVIDNVSRRFDFSEGTRKGVLSRLIEGGDLSRYGLHAAVTRHSADEADYDEATRLERVGGQIIELPRNDWHAILDMPERHVRRKAA